MKKDQKKVNKDTLLLGTLSYVSGYLNGMAKRLTHTGEEEMAEEVLELKDKLDKLSKISFK